LVIRQVSQHIEINPLALWVALWLGRSWDQSCLALALESAQALVV
jgi:hypothetical protein